MASVLLGNYKLIVTILKKGAARKAVRASKSCGAEGGTTLLAQGSGIRDKENILGITMLPEKELILTLICNEDMETVLEQICDSCQVQRPRHGLAFVLDVAGVTGICHLCQLEEANNGTERGPEMETDSLEAAGNTAEKKHNLIVTIVNKGDSEVVLEASKKAGARGGTILFGRGTGIHEQAKLFGITIEPEKDIILTLIERPQTEQILESIIQAVQLDEAGQGIAFVLKVDRVTGISEIEKLKKSQVEK